MLTPDTQSRDIDEEFEEAVAEWRERHQVREDDAVLLLLELFRIHQQHWDEVRRREMPSFEQVRGDIVRLAQTIRDFQCEAVTLNTALRSLPNAGHIPRVTRTVAVFATLAAMLAGYLIGRAWP